MMIIGDYQSAVEYYIEDMKTRNYSPASMELYHKNLKHFNDFLDTIRISLVHEITLPDTVRTQ